MALADAGGHSVSQAELQASTSDRWVVSHRWTDWESEVVWMSLYFSVAVWLSIGLMHASQTLSTRQKALRLDQDQLRSVHMPIWLKDHLIP